MGDVVSAAAWLGAVRNFAGVISFFFFLLLRVRFRRERVKTVLCRPNREEQPNPNWLVENPNGRTTTWFMPYLLRSRDGAATITRSRPSVCAKCARPIGLPEPLSCEWELRILRLETPHYYIFKHISQKEGLEKEVATSRISTAYRYTHAFRLYPG